MAKKPMKMDDKAINQHKRMAMGEKITGMKKGGEVDMKEKPKKKGK